jgi:hypothetical protein
MAGHMHAHRIFRQIPADRLHNWYFPPDQVPARTAPAFPIFNGIVAQKKVWRIAGKGEIVFHLLEKRQKRLGKALSAGRVRFFSGLLAPTVWLL